MRKSILALSGFFLVAGCSEPPVEIEKPLRPVRVLTVSAPDLNMKHEFTAVVDASRKADLSFKVSGELKEFLVSQGDSVAKDQVIAKLDDNDIRIQLNEADSLFDKAKADFNRGKNLIKSSSISQADFDQLRAQYNSAKAKFATAKNNLIYTELKASFDGVIAKKYTENFQEVSARSPIVALHDIANINLKINVPENIMIRVQKSNRPTNMIARFNAIKDVDFPLVFKEVSTQADEVTGTYEVTLTMVAPEDHTILPGMTALVYGERMPSGKEESLFFLLPAKTVLKDSKGNFVYIVTAQGNGIGVIERRQVRVGDISEFGIEIYSGLTQGDKVLSAGMSKVSHGMKVKYSNDSEL